MIRLTTAVLTLTWLTLCAAQRGRPTFDGLMNICLDGRYHKFRATPEAGLHGHCAPWSGLSCCSADVTKQLHLQDRWYNLSYDHCPGRKLSAKCHEHFTKDLCFYECSPNLGPWLEPVTSRIRNEKFYHAPLCESQCTAWWNDCKDDYTCIDNWGKDFKWSKAGNSCPQGSVCRPFHQVFGNSRNFCEKIWNYSWTVVPDSQPCMKIDFTGPNPNRQVAERQARRMLGSPPVSGPGPVVG